MNILLPVVALVAWLLVIFTAAGLLLDFNTARCTLRGNSTWLAILAIALGAGYQAMEVCHVTSAWEVLLPVGLAAACVIKAPGPWWSWIMRGELHQRRSVDRRVAR